MGSSVKLVAALSVLALASAVASCLFDFDSYDPRLGPAGPGGAGAGATGAGGGAAGAGGQGASGGTSPGGAGGGAAAGGGVGGGGAGGSGGGVTTLSYPATVSDCLYQEEPDPDLCATHALPGSMTVDLSDSAYNSYEGHAYLRFEVDGQLAGKSVVGLSLRLHTANDPDADSSHSGEVWQVACFVRPDLFGATPAPMGNAPVAGDLGAVTENSTVLWSLSPGLVAASTPLCLSIVPTSTNGVDYLNKDASDPAQAPALLIDVQ